MLTLSTEPNSVSLAGNPLFFKVLTTQAGGTPYTPSTFPALHRLDVEIRIEETLNSNVFTSIGSVSSRIADDTYHYVFDVSATLLDYFQNSVKSLTTPIQSGATFVPPITRRYQIKIEEKNGTTLIDQFVQIYTATFGRDELDTDFPFTGWLSLFPAKRYADLTKPVLVTYFNDTPTDFDFSPKFTLHGLNNEVLTVIQETELSVPLPFPPVTIPPNTAVTFNLGGLDFGSSYPLSHIGKMVFEGGVTPLTIYNDIQDSPQNRLILYRNRFGVMETLVCTGEILEEKDLNRYEAITAGNYAVASQYYGHRRQYDADVSTTYTFRTGFLRKHEKEALSDMFVLNDVWYVSNGKYIPVRLLDTKFEAYDSFEDLSAWQFRASLRNVTKI